MDDSEAIGVHVRCCDIRKTKYYFRRPAVSVHLIDRRKGQYIEKTVDVDSGGPAFLEPVVTKNHDTVEKRCASPSWDELLVLDEKVSVLEKNTDVAFMFDLFDDILDSKNNKTDRIRIAWAFLIPKISEDSSFLINKELKLQLYKPRKSCKISHHTCNIFHLYADHKWKKLHGILYATVKGVISNKNGATAEVESKTNNLILEENKPSLGEVSIEPKPSMKITRWSRLPTQSCKIPNHVAKMFNVGRKGGSYVRFGRTGSHVAIASFSRIYVYDVISGEQVCDFNGHNDLVYELDWSPEDKFLLSVSSDCTAAVWSVSAKSPLFVLPHPSFVYCGKWLGSSDQLLTGGKDHVVRHWCKCGDAFELKEEIGGHHGFVTALAVQDDSVIFSGDSEGCLAVQKRVENAWILIKSLTFDETTQKAIDAIHVHPGGRRILLSLRGRGTFMVDVVTGVVLQAYKTMVNACARSVSALTPCGSSVYSFCLNGEMNVWEVDTGKLSAVYENLFPVDRLTEFGSCIDYHPFEHYVAFTVLGHNYPAYILSYEASTRKDDSKKLGLTFKRSETENDIDSGATGTSGKSGEPLLSLSAIKPDKLASIVQKMDQVFTVKHYVQNDWSH